MNYVCYIYIYIYEQYNPETACRNTAKLKHFIPIKKMKHLPKWNWQPCFIHVRFENEHSPCFSHGDDVEEEIWLLWTVEFVSLLPFFLSILYLLSPITQLLWVQPFCFWTLRGFFPAQDFPYSPCFTLNQMTTNCQVGFWDLTLEIASCLSWSEYLIY